MENCEGFHNNFQMIGSFKQEAIYFFLIFWVVLHYFAWIFPFIFSLILSSSQPRNQFLLNSINFHFKFRTDLAHHYEVLRALLLDHQSLKSLYPLNPPLSPCFLQLTFLSFLLSYLKRLPLQGQLSSHLTSRPKWPSDICISSLPIVGG